MANILEKFGVKGASDLTFINRRTNQIDLVLDFANQISLEVSSESVDALAKGEPVLSWAQPKEGTLTATGQIMSFGLLALIFGSKLKSGAGEIFKTEKKVFAGSNTVALEETPKSGTLGVAVLLEDGSSIGKTFTVVEGSSVPKEGEVVLNGKDVKFFAGDVPSGATVMYCYLSEKSTGVHTFSVSSVSESDSYAVYGLTQAKYVTGDNKFFELHIFNATPEQNTSLSFDSENPSEISLTMKVLADPTKKDENGNSKMFDFVAVG